MISQTEKTVLRDKITDAFNEFTKLISSFEENTINRIPFAGSWTPAQVAIHIILATDGVPDTKTADSDRPFDSFLSMIRPWWEDLNQKFNSPEQLVPDDKTHGTHELISRLHLALEKDLDIIANDDLTKICLDFELPKIGYLTRYEWLWFIEMHLKRHCFQLKNMQAYFGK